MTQFSACLALVLSEEGGYVNHPSDPGGATMKGVIQTVYNTYRRSRKLAARDVRQITDNELQAIYRSRYWDLVKADQLPFGVDLVVFDAAVNSGPGQSMKWLQRGLNALKASEVPLKDDGLIGPATLEALSSCSDHAALINDVCDRRLAMLRKLKTYPTFGKGWRARVGRMRANGLVMAADPASAPSKPEAAASETDAAADPEPAAAGGFGAVIAAFIKAIFARRTA
ncbi:glycoside hydrolase family 108 protein [Martelella alba]|nr:glycosyl hydrolase 108 family protein [Martelella alba]